MVTLVPCRWRWPLLIECGSGGLLSVFAAIVPGHSFPFCVVVSDCRLWVAGMGVVFACRSCVWSLGDVAWSLSVVWWSWVEESTSVTPCDIYIMFSMRSHADMNFEVCLECYTTNVCCICFFP